MMVVEYPNHDGLSGGKNKDLGPDPVKPQRWIWLLGHCFPFVGVVAGPSKDPGKLDGVECSNTLAGCCLIVAANEAIV